MGRKCLGWKVLNRCYARKKYPTPAIKNAINERSESKKKPGVGEKKEKLIDTMK